MLEEVQGKGKGKLYKENNDQVIEEEDREQDNDALQKY